MHEHFEHTADLGLRVRAPDLDTLFAEAAEALTAAIVEDVATVEPRTEAVFHIDGADPAYLLFDWLKALLLKFEIDHLLFSRFAVRVGGDGLTATAGGEPYDPDRHPLSHEVKAITYHGLQVEQTPDGTWWAEVIVDI
ncbi:MAG TPA: archease [Gemmataceae bacterium]|jgi:SHS2 domain-containing protein